MPYDVAIQLRTPEEIEAYLNAWLTEAPDDAHGITRALVDIDRGRYRLLHSKPIANKLDKDS